MFGRKESCCGTSFESPLVKYQREVAEDILIEEIVALEFGNDIASSAKFDNDVETIVLLSNTIAEPLATPFYEFADLSTVLDDEILDLFDDGIDLMIIERGVNDEGRFRRPFLRQA